MSLPTSQSRIASRPSAVQQAPPPSTASGRFAFSSIAINCGSASGAGCGGSTCAGPISGTEASSFCISSEIATTTGPGRPLVATSKACAISSGMRLASSIWVTHLASGPNILR